jgi:hypothetical protein
VVRSTVEEKLKMDIALTIKHMHDLRNYKVSIEKAKNVLSFKPKHGAESIVNDLIEHRERFKDYDNPKYYNIQVFKSLRD